MNQKIRLMLVNNNPNSLQNIKDLLAPFKEVKMPWEAASGQEALDMLMKHQPDIVIIDTTMPRMDGFQTTQRIKQLAPYIGVILVGSGSSPDSVRKAMQSGANDFLEQPLTGSKLYHSIIDIYTLKSQQKQHLMNSPLLFPSRQTKVISVFSTKGGVGKSMLATNLAVGLREETKEDVLLMDLDLQFGDVADMLNLEAKTSIIDIPADRVGLEPKDLNQYLSTHASGIQVLPAPHQPEQADLIGAQDVVEIIALYSQIFEFIIIDLPPLLNQVVLGCIERSDHILFVTTMEIPTLKNVKGGLDILQKINIPEEKIKVILNRHRASRELKLEDIRAFLGKQELSCIDDSPDLVSYSINSGEPLIMRHRETLVAKQLLQLTRSFQTSAESETSKAKPSLFQRLFSKGGQHE